MFFEAIWNGQTPGKRVVGIRVVRIDGRPIGFGQAATRNLVRVLDALPVYYAIGVLVMFLNKSQRRLGDLAAGTVVVHEGASQRLQALPRLEARLAIDPLLVRRLRPDEYDLIRRFLLRRDELLPAPPASRALRRSSPLCTIAASCPIPTPRRCSSRWPRRTASWSRAVAGNRSLLATCRWPSHRRHTGSRILKCVRSSRARSLRPDAMGIGPQAPPRTHAMTRNRSASRAIHSASSRSAGS
ncbi:MAG: RDD family protein [Armatimonadetes bacterium]|nr:RDD family protein [Armatimonadota bacterium]